MKKFLAVLAAGALALSVGCSKDDTTAKKKEENKPAAQTEKKDDANKSKITLLNFEGDLVTHLRDYHAPFNAYAAALGKEEKPAQEDLDKLKADAKAAGEKAVSEIPSMEVPSDLSKDDQDTLKAALEDLKKSYETRIASLDDAAKTEEADTLFASFEEKVNKIHTEMKLLPANFAKEVE